MKTLLEQNSKLIVHVLDVLRVAAGRFKGFPQINYFKHNFFLTKWHIFIFDPTYYFFSFLQEIDDSSMLKHTAYILYI